jgi:hypothetical protein
MTDNPALCAHVGAIRYNSEAIPKFLTGYTTTGDVCLIGVEGTGTTRSVSGKPVRSCVAEFKRNFPELQQIPRRENA